MATKAKSKKRNPRSEAAMREAGKLMRLVPKTWDMGLKVSREPFILEYHAIGRLIAIFDLRDCYRKRKPLKGVAKELKKVMQRRR